MDALMKCSYIEAKKRRFGSCMLPFEKLGFVGRKNLFYGEGLLYLSMVKMSEFGFLEQ